MACERWTEKLDPYVDGELPVDEARAMDEHFRGCASCAAEGLRRVQQKCAVQAAGQRFIPDPAFRARIQKSIAAPAPALWSGRWLGALVAATAAALLIAGVFILALRSGRRNEQQLLSELVDQHVATLASSNPVDVVSTDRHTVKPWFAGKIPFTFNLPELQGSAFVLVGGKVCYVSQSPGAELIFRVRQHQISVFILQEQGPRQVRENESQRTALSFEVRTWRHNGLRYFVVGDASAGDLDQLSELIKAAG
jgi:anti-sigma factor RsiW